MNIIKILVVALLIICLLGTWGAAGEREPSTEKERKKVVQLVTLLEEEPYSDDAKEARKWLTMFLIEVPDIEIRWCTETLGDISKFDTDYDSIVSTQTLFSAAKFIIQNPDRAGDDVAVNEAALMGALRVYEIIVSDNTKPRISHLDKLLKLRDEGTLSGHVRKAVKKCS